MLVLIATPAWSAEFYVDPEHGDNAHDGSRSRPWQSIQQLIDKGMIETQKWAELPYRAGVALVPQHSGAPIQAGDTIYLLSGYHGELLIKNAYNAQPITVAAAEGHQPKLKRVQIRSGAGWILRGLHISPEFAPSYERITLLDLDSHGFSGPVREIVVEQCHLQSVEDATAWSAQDWNMRACNGIEVDGERMTVRDCHLQNVNFGISVSASHSLIERNTVENFSGDGMRGLGDHTTFQYNTVKNCYDVNQNHDDGFQSWSRGADGRVGTGEVRGIVLRGNVIVNYEDPQQPHRGALQGIGCFDGMFVDWVVENNVVVTDHFHGITLSGARNCRIVNNTVVDLNETRPGPPWIRIGDHKNGSPSSGCVVRNNLTTAVHVTSDQDHSVDHNLILQEPNEFFRGLRHARSASSKGAKAIDAGSSELAPPQDADQVPRPQGSRFDIGAYEYRGRVDVLATHAPPLLF